MLVDLLPKSHTGLVCDMSNNEVENGKIIEEFAKAGRTGRRNALPDVFSIPHASCGTAGLTAALEQLQTSAATSKGNGVTAQTQTTVTTTEQSKK